MNIDINDGFNLIYAKIGCSPKNIFLETKSEVLNFIIDNREDIDFLSINDVTIDKNELLKKLFK